MTPKNKNGFSLCTSSPHPARMRGRTGFTLVEVLIVLALITLLAALLYPAISRVRDEARCTACASNLRQMAAAALVYANEHGGQFPWAYRRVAGYRSWSWDFRIAASGEVQPGLLWEGVSSGGANRVLQCPAYLNGASNAPGDPYTGYNYNTSYIGKAEGDSGSRKTPARLSQLKEPGRTALFGDGQYEGGANKYMRAPVREKAFDGSGKSTRLAGTQGFRHRGKTNVAFCDGHVESLRKPYTADGSPGNTAPGCGFLSPDNRLYSLDKD